MVASTSMPIALDGDKHGIYAASRQLWLLSSAADRSHNHIFPVANDLMQEWPTEQFATLVEFQILSGTGKVNGFALAYERQRLDAGCNFRSRSIGNRNDLPGKFNRVCRFGFLDRNREGCYTPVRTGLTIAMPSPADDARWQWFRRKDRY
jgi:hypothetical protein